ncbi:ester cyclase [Chitinophaga pendula]|uniref:ester cyclase n=1 Tax=Chitinophaga TaxID=79328 RepID=UPI0012FE601E|nr:MULTISPECIES: ester cyclase [Chitinophaga]UCJ08790.1 ester cyclase [Chitinophaga pendula]
MSAVIPSFIVLAFASLLLPGCGRVAERRPVSQADQNRQIVSRYFSQVWNEGRLEELDVLLSPGYINHTPSVPDPPPGPAGLKPIVSALRTAFPDLHYEIQDLVVNDSMAVARVTVSGTHKGPLFGRAATGKKFTVNQINIERIVRGRIVEHWRVTDELSMMQQLGLIR